MSNPNFFVSSKGRGKRALRTTVNKKNISQEVRSLKATLRQMGTRVQGEQKAHYVVPSQTNPTTTMSIDDITQIAEGSDNTNREGRAILLKSVHGRFSVFQNSAPTLPATFVRMLVVQCKTGVLPTAASDFLYSATNDWAVTPSFSPEARAAYKILCDEIVVVSQNGQEGAVLSFDLPLNLRMTFSGTSSTTGFTNRLALCYVSSDTLAPPQILGNSAVRFIDN